MKLAIASLLLAALCAVLINLWWYQPMATPVALPKASTASAPSAQAELVAPAEVHDGLQERRELPVSVPSAVAPTSESTSLADAAIRVELTDVLSTPLAGETVLLTAQTDLPIPTPMRSTNSGGVARFEGLLPGTYTVEARHARTKLATSTTINLPAHQELAVPLQLSHPEDKLAISGYVLDESGVGLAGVTVRVSPCDAKKATPVTDAAGAFEAWCRPCEQITLHTGSPSFLAREVDRGVFEPSPLKVPFGTPNVVIRRTRPLATVKGCVQFVDRATGQLVQGVILRFDHEVPYRGSSLFDGNPIAFEVLDEAKVRWEVVVPGYRSRGGELVALLLERARSGALGPGDCQRLRTPGASDHLLVVALDRGFERVLSVIEAGTQKPIMGAEAYSEAWVLLGSTDTQGNVPLQSEVVPAVIWVRASGYEQTGWHPNNIDARVELKRAGTR